MSFGGGGSSAIGNHVHDNNPGEGGALSTTLTLIGPDILYNLLTTPDPQIAINTSAIAGLTSNKGKWSATNVATFKTSVIAGVQAGTIEEVT